MFLFNEVTYVGIDIEEIKTKKPIGFPIGFVGVDGFEPPTLCL